MDKYTVVHPNNGILFKTKKKKKKERESCHAMKRHGQTLNESEKSQSENVTYCMISTI